VKVGDIVRQNNTLVNVRSAGKLRQASVLFGVVVDIHDQEVPKENETEWLRSWMSQLGKLVDVLWSNGRLTKDFAEKGLDVVKEEGNVQ
jgi:hypothetical protein